jgi:hypothetical protein
MGRAAGRAPPWEGSPRPKQTRAPQPPHTANSALPKAGPEARPTQRSPLPGAQRHGITASRKPSAPQRPDTQPHDPQPRQCVEVNQQAGPHGWQKSRRAMVQRRRKTGQKPAVGQGDVRPGAPEGDDGGPGPVADRTDAKKDPLFRRFAQVGLKKSCRAEELAGSCLPVRACAEQPHHRPHDGRGGNLMARTHRGLHASRHTGPRRLNA